MNAHSTSAQVETIAQLSARLNDVCAERAAQNDRLAYFAALYGLMTGRVAEGIATGRFEDGARMERLACHFARRYIAALGNFDNGGKVPASWLVAFEAASRWRPIILQHLVLGINAHINFDLGIAAAEVAGTEGLEAVRRDFLEINAVLAELLEDVQRRLADVSPWMGILDAVGGRKDEVIVNFSMERARDAAWRVAEQFSALEGSARAAAEQRLDVRVAKFARVILRPGPIVSVAALPVRFKERASAREVVDAFA